MVVRLRLTTLGGHAAARFVSFPRAVAPSHACVSRRGEAGPLRVLVEPNYKARRAFLVVAFPLHARD